MGLSMGHSLAKSPLGFPCTPLVSTTASGSMGPLGLTMPLHGTSSFKD